ncbi:hypothetical protein BRADI_3g23113v3 [Brachypodium distachyon]|uniref:Uncharacterized protein n=1 Tax=Brachypodium distachyon TaxID=15368 RepID=A0A0Q3F9E9_BRADI|nr:hypothetical protein BRADI_3g23113v3 [Brachypodium distachyon]
MEYGLHRWLGHACYDMGGIAGEIALDRWGAAHSKEGGCRTRRAGRKIGKGNWDNFLLASFIRGIDTLTNWGLRRTNFRK